MKTEQVLKEAFVVGLMTVAVGSLVGKMLQVNSPTARKTLKWLFITGVLIHILCEVSGINTWYCRHGSACSV
jgi:hypothetical protein